MKFLLLLTLLGVQEEVTKVAEDLLSEMGEKEVKIVVNLDESEGFVASMAAQPGVLSLQINPQFWALYPDLHKPIIAHEIGHISIDCQKFYDHLAYIYFGPELAYLNGEACADSIAIYFTGQQTVRDMLFTIISWLGDQKLSIPPTLITRYNMSVMYEDQRRD